MSARTLTRSALAATVVAALALVAGPASADPPPVGPIDLLPPVPQPDQPGVSISDSWAYEADGDILFELSLDAPAELGDNVIVGFNHLDTVDEDFVAQGFNVSFDDGQTEATLDVPITQFDGTEGFEHFQMYLVDPVGLEIEDGIGNGVLYDANGPVIDLGDGEVIEGDPGDSTYVEFEVTLSYPLPEAMSLRFATTEIDGKAIAGGDYEPVDQVMLWAAGSTSATYEVAIVEDELIEADEVFVTWIADPTVGVVHDDTAVGTIVNDDHFQVEEVPEEVPENDDVPSDGVDVEGETAARADLPFTGSPTMALGLVGSALVGLGSLLVLWRRRQDPQADA